MAPRSWNGSNIVYFKVIRPFVLRYEDAIEDTISKATKFGKEAVAEGILICPCSDGCILMKITTRSGVCMCITC